MRGEGAVWAGEAALEEQGHAPGDDDGCAHTQAGGGRGGGAFRVREWHPLKSRGMRLGRMTAVHTGRGEGGGGAVKGGLSGQEHRTHGSRIIRVRR